MKKINHFNYILSLTKFTKKNERDAFKAKSCHHL